MTTPDQLDQETKELMKMVDEHMKQVDQWKARIAEIKTLKQQLEQDKEDALRLIDYEKFQQGGQSIYERYLQEEFVRFCEDEKHWTNGGRKCQLQRGPKWDSFVSPAGVTRYKVEKRTGDIYRVNSKRPEGHLIHPTLHSE